jgi:hypothetical protein
MSICEALLSDFSSRKAAQMGRFPADADFLLDVQLWRPSPDGADAFP